MIMNSDPRTSVHLKCCLLLLVEFEQMLFFLETAGFTEHPLRYKHDHQPLEHSW